MNKNETMNNVIKDTIENKEIANKIIEGKSITLDEYESNVNDIWHRDCKLCTEEQAIVCYNCKGTLCSDIVDLMESLIIEED